MLTYVLSKLLTVLVFLIIFSVIVVSHEFGHFLLGRLNGIKVNEFAIGMGPTIYKKKLKSTILKIHLFPIGGACIFENDDELLFLNDKDKDDELKDNEFRDEDNDNSSDSDIDEELLDETYDLPGGKFNDAPVWGRIATVLAGPVFNFITAFIFCLIIVWFYGQDLPVVYDLSDNYPAMEAGIKKGDTILKIDNHRVRLWREVSVISSLNYGEPLEIVYERDGQQYTTVVTPKYNEEEGRYYIGFVGMGQYKDCKNISVFKYTFYELRYMTFAVFKSLGHLTSEHGSIDDLSGPVGIADVIDDTLEESRSFGVFITVMQIVNLIVLLSVNLGIMNLLPFPAIDGGRLIFLLIELVTGKRVPPDKEGFVHLIGIILLMILMVAVCYNDVLRIIERFF